MNTVYISKEGLEKLKQELEVLKYTKIPEIANKIDTAKENGDLSENAEYQDAKEQMAFAQGKSLEMQAQIDNAQIIEHKSGGSIVEVGSKVTFTTESGDEKSYSIVGVAEADPVSGMISNESPIGRAFLGKAVGDEVEVERPSGAAKYTVTAIG